MDRIASKEDYIINSGQIYPDDPGRTSLTVTLDIDWQQGYDHCCVTSLSIPKTYYVLPEDAKLTLTEDKSAVDITVPRGNYNVNSMSLVLTTLLTDNSPTSYTYTVTYSDSFTQTDRVTFTITVTNNAGTQPTLTMTDGFLANTLGFYPDVVYEFASDVLESAKVINMQAYDEILIKTDMVENRSNLLQEVYTAGDPYNSSIVWHCPDVNLYAKKMRRTAGNIYHFTIQTVDGGQVDLHGSSWSFVLSIFKFDNLGDLIKRYIQYKATADAVKQAPSPE